MKKVIILALLRNMEIIFVLSLLALGFILSITVFDTDCNKLMKPIKAIKLEEQEEGKIPPIYDGVTEPNFPDENQNAKGLRGVDSNKDGVRDDIEIWINRKAEDSDVRMAFKEMYRKRILLIKAANGKETVDEVVDIQADFIEAFSCLSSLVEKYKNRYENSWDTANEYYLDALFSFTSNTSVRQRLDSVIQIVMDGKTGSHTNGLLKVGLEACSFRAKNAY